MPEIRILLIEDEVTSREIFRLILGDTGYVVDVVASASAGAAAWLHLTRSDGP